MSTGELIRLCAESDVKEGAPVRVVLDGHPVLAVFRVDTEIYIVDDECTHGKASLVEDGTVEDHKVKCGWHDCQFDLPTGESYGFPCTEPLRTYTPIIKEGAIYFNGEPRPRID